MTRIVMGMKLMLLEAERAFEKGACSDSGNTVKFRGDESQVWKGNFKAVEAAFVLRAERVWKRWMPIFWDKQGNVREVICKVTTWV